MNSGKPIAPVIMDNKKDQDDDEDDTFIVEEDPSLQNFLEVVRFYWSDLDFSFVLCLCYHSFFPE